jgi:large subunit ribosomal protein L22
MVEHKYAFQAFNKELMARGMGRDLPISTKQAIEICNFLRKRKLAQAKNLLEGVIEKKTAVPFKRFTNGLGHKPGKMAAGRFPVKASKACLALLESVEANAQTKGLNTGELEIIHICAHKAHSPVHYGRHQGREFKRTHVEVIVQETAGKSRKETKEVKKEAPKKEEPKAAVPKKEEVKTEEPKPAKSEKPAEAPTPESTLQEKKEEKKEPKEEAAKEEKPVEAPAEEKKEEAATPEVEK